MGVHLIPDLASTKFLILTCMGSDSLDHRPLFYVKQSTGIKLHQKLLHNIKLHKKLLYSL